ncbi:hypothetical protein L7F22_016600 [Adiantum nelumboides]|nr:hypothetical protein [Adiantum nelumboides]
MASVHPFLARNQSVSHGGERQQALQSAAANMMMHHPPHKRRTKSFSSSDADPPPPHHHTLPPSSHPHDGASTPAPSVKFANAAPSPSPAPLLSSAPDDVDHALHELFRGKTKAKTGASFGGLLTGLFSCWNPRKSSTSDAPISASKHVAVLLEISKKQQFELANKQDTIDMLEWQLEQMQSMERQMEADSALLSADLISDEENRKPADLNKLESEDCKRDTSNNYKKKIQFSKESTNAGQKQGEGKNSNEECTHEEDAAHPLLADRRIATLSLFEMATVRARFSVRSFGKALIKQLEASGYSVLKTLMELEPYVVFTRKEHVVYALESRINKAFYHCFENDNFDNSGLMQILNPVSRCAVRLEEFQKLKLVEVSNAVNSTHPAFNEEFRRFCERKTRELWSQFSWSIAFNTSEEQDVFTAAFLDAAKGVWLLHRLAFSLHPHVVILRVGKGLQIDSQYVEALPELVDGKPCPSCLQTKVEFLVVPGFHAMDKVIKCQVYQHIHC